MADFESICKQFAKNNKICLNVKVTEIGKNLKLKIVKIEGEELTLFEMSYYWR